MTGLFLLQAAAGLGLVLAGLRLLIRALDEPLTAPVTAALAAVSRGAAAATAAGLGSTLVFQASSLTIIGTMGLLQRSMIPLEQAVAVMLGAALGSSLKAWAFALPFTVLGPAMVAAASGGLVLARRHSRRKQLEALLAMGLLFLGWSMLGDGLRPALESPAIHSTLSRLDAASFLGVLFSVAVGAALTAVVQSSTTIVFLTVALVTGGLVPFLGGAAVVLGANLGTTVTPLYAALEYGHEARRLALIHVIVKAAGVLVAAFFFRSFLVLVGVVVEPFFPMPSAAVRLAGVHVVFNALNLALWLPLAPVLARASGFLVQPRVVRRAFVLAGPVRRMLVNEPVLGLREVERERDRLVRELKILVDRVLTLASDADPPPELRTVRQELMARVQAAQELRVALAARGPEPMRPSDGLLRDLSELAEAFDECFRLLRRLDAEPPRFRRARAAVLTPVLASLRARVEAVWAHVLEPERDAADPPVDPEAFDRFEQDCLAALQASGYPQEEGVVLLSGVFLHLRRLWGHIEDLAARRQRARAM